MTVRPGIGFKLRPPIVKVEKVKVVPKLKFRGLCTWCGAKGADLLSNKYGLFHSNKIQDCFKEFFFFAIKSRDESQTTPPPPTA